MSSPQIKEKGYHIHGSLFLFVIKVVLVLGMQTLASCSSKEDSGLLLGPGNKYYLSKGEVELIKTKTLVASYGDRFNNSNYYQLPLLHSLKLASGDSLFIGLLLEDSDSKRFLAQLNSDTSSGKITENLSSPPSPLIQVARIELQNRNYNRYVAVLNGSIMVFFNNNSNTQLKAGADSLIKKITLAK